MTHRSDTSVTGPQATPYAGSGLTRRAVLLGLLLVALVNVADPYFLYVVHSSLIASDYMPIGVLFPFFLVVTVVNAIVKRVSPGSAFHPPELMIIFIMSLTGASIPTYGLSGYLISIISSPYFYASPENKWAEYLHPYLPSWLLPTDTTALRWFFDGLPPGASIPWAAWAVPLFWWLSLLSVVVFVCMCMIVVLRKHWVENERLLFPLVELPLQMAEGSDGRSIWPPFVRNRLFWIGFLVPLLMVLSNIPHYFSPFVPQIPIGGWGVDKFTEISIARGFPTIQANVYPAVIGFAFLMNLDILFSFWFFHLLAVVQAGIYARTGFSLGSSEHYSSEFDASIAWQSWGAFVVMVIYSLWRARRHIRDVVRKSLSRRLAGIDDSDELFSYRKAMLGIILGTVYIACWLHAMGMSWFVISLFLPAVFIIYLGTTRIVTEGGLAFARGPMVAQGFTSFVIGSNAIPPQSMTALAVSYAGFCEIKTSWMPSMANCAKLSDSSGGKRRHAVIAMGIALVAAVAISIPWTIYLGYAHGAYSFSTWIFTPGGTIPYEYMVQKMRNPFGLDLGRLGFLGIGAIVMALLTFLRARFSWWPLNPIGMTLSASWPVKTTAMSLFIGWMCKSIIVKWGGIDLYRKSRPVFFGLILGHFTGVAISNIVDAVWFTGRGHWLYGLY